MKISKPFFNYAKDMYYTGIMPFPAGKRQEQTKRNPWITFIRHPTMNWRSNSKALNPSPKEENVFHLMTLKRLKNVVIISHARDQLKF